MKELYNALFENGDYTGTFEEFKDQFGDADKSKGLYKAMNDAGDYTGTVDEFNSQFEFKAKTEAVTEETADVTAVEETVVEETVVEEAAVDTDLESEDISLESLNALDVAVDEIASPEEPTEFYKEKSAELNANISEMEKQLSSYEEKGGTIDSRDAKILQSYKDELAGLDTGKIGIKQRIANAASNIPTQLESAWEATKAGAVDWISTVAGEDAADFLVDLTGDEPMDLGPIVFIDPETNEEVSFKNDPDKFKKLNSAQAAGESVKTIYQNTKKEVGETADEYIIEKFKEVTSLNSSMKDVGSITKGINTGDKEEFIGGMVNAVSSLLTTAVPAALTRGASLFPQIVAPMYTDFNEEKAKAKYPDSSDPLKELVTNDETEVAIPIVLGGVSMALEAVGLKGISKAISKQTGKLAPFARLLLTNNKEGLTEVAQLGVENVNKSLAKGKSLPEATLDGLKSMATMDALENYAQGFVGSGIITAPSSITKALNGQPSSIAFINKNINQLGALQQARAKNKNKAFREAVDLEIADTEAKLKDHFTDNYYVSKSFSQDQQNEITSIIDKKENNQILIRNLKNSFDAGEMSFQQYGGAKSALVKNNKKLSSEIGRIRDDVSQELLQTNIKAAEDLSSELGFKEKPQVFETTVDYLTAIKKAGFDESQAVGSEGTFIGKGRIFIDKQKAVEVQAVSVATHEILHPILNALVGDDKAQGSLIDEFKKSMSSSQLDYVQKKLDKNVKKENHNTEFLNYFSDGIVKGDIKYDENIFQKIKNVLKKVFKSQGFENIDFKKGEDVYNFLKAYNKGAVKGKIDKDVVGAIKKGEKQLDVKVSEVDLISDPQQSRSADKAKNALEAVKFENLKKPRAQGIIGTELPGMVRAQVFNQYSGLGNQKIQDFTDEVVERIYAAKENEKWGSKDGKEMESKGSLYGFINGRINMRIKDVVKKEYSRDPLERLYFSGKDGNQFDALENAADVAVEETSETIERPKYKNLLESKVLSSDVLKGVKDKVLKTVRTLKSRMDAKVSLNKTITPLVSEIKKDMGKQADIDLKKAMGSKKDGQLKNFLVNNKKSILENMTTTWLMGAMPGAIQKQVDGKFTSDWQGKKIDRETVNTNSAGKTSGAEIVRRLPNASQNINDEVFLGYILDAKGNPIRGRKESLAKALAEEVSFDIFNQQLKDPESDISKAFENNQEALGVVIADNLVEDISRQLDRGTIKFSKNLIELNEKNPGLTNAIIDGVTSERFKTRFIINNNDPNNNQPLFTSLGEYFKEFPIKNITKGDIKKIATELSAEFTFKPFGEIGIKRVEEAEGVLKTLKYIQENIKEGATRGNSYATAQLLNQNLDIQLDTKTLKGLNEGRQELGKVVKILADDGFTGNEIKNIFGAMYGPSGIGGFKGKLASKKNQNSKGDKRAVPNSDVLIESDLGPVNYNKSGGVENRGAFMISEADFAQNFLKDIEMGDKVSTRTDAYTKTFWTDPKSVYNKLPTNQDKKNYLQELQKAKPEFQASLIKYIEAINKADISPAAQRNFIRLPFAAMEGLGKITSAPRWMPSLMDGTLLSHDDMIKLGFGRKDGKVDDGVFEHTKPANRMAIAAYIYSMTGKQSDLDILLEELSDFDTAFITKGMDIDLVKNKLQSLMGLNYVRGEGVMGTRYMEMVIEMAKKGVTFYDAKTNTLMEGATVFSEQVESEMEANIEKGKAKEDAVKKSKPTPQFSKNLNKDFNDILERSKGIASDANFSRIVAKRRGASIGKFKVWMPSSLNDFKGLTSYTFAGKGRQGDADQKFFKEKLIDPYFKGIAEIESSRQRMKDDFVILNKLHKPVVKSLGKLIESKDYSNDQAIRVYLWDKAGFEIPGLSKRDQKKLLKHIDENPDLKAYADQVLLVSKQPTWIKPGAFWDAQTILSDLGNMTEKVGRKEYISEFIENADIVFSEANLNKIEALYGTRHRDALEDILYRMKNGTNRPVGASKNQNIFNNWVNNSIGAIMFFNRRSALLQTLSTVNFLNWSDNNPVKAAAAFANQPQYWKDFSTIFNSAKLKQRRSGLKSDINEAEIASAVKGSKNKATAALSWLLKKGFLPTQMADSFAIAAGGATFYRNRINTLMKKGMSKTEAEAKAFSDFSEISEETQQSGDPALISSDQASVVGRLFLAFQNTPIQLNRSIKKSAQDIYNRRRMPGQTQMQSDFSNMSKIVYYGAIQNIIFTSLSNALFALIPGFDDDEPTEEELQKLEETKLARMASGIIDTTLKGGFGLPGAVLATIKNVIMEYNKQDEKGFKADHTYTIIQAINLAPPIGSKVGKIYSGIQGKTFNRRVIEKRGFDVKAFDKFNLSPKYSVWGKYAEGATNLPLGRAVDEINAIVEAFDTRNTVMQRVALGLGWRTWDIGVENEENDLINVAEKAKEAKEKKAKKKKKKLRSRFSAGKSIF